MTDREKSRLLIPPIVLQSLAGLLVAQSPKPLNTFVPPTLLEYVVEAVLAKDNGCAQDYAQVSMYEPPRWAQPIELTRELGPGVNGVPNLASRGLENDV